MKINKIELRNWLRRIEIATVSTLLISFSAVASGQQCTQCGVALSDWGPRSQLGAAHRLAGERGLVGGGGGALASARQNVATLVHRETPPGNLGLHFPYTATQMYYYRRPYNDFHVAQHLGESRDSPAQSTLGQGLGYSSQIFEQVHNATEGYYNSQYGTELDKDGLLEFVDWRDHRQEQKLSGSSSGFGPEYNSERTLKATSTEKFRDSFFQRRVSSRLSASSLNERK